MLERFKYINHLGETVYFGQDNVIFVNNSDIRDFRWDVISQNDRISGFEKGMQTHTIPVRIGAADPDEAMEAMNRLFEIPEKDVLAKKPGRLVVGGFYLVCYLVASSKGYYADKRFMSASIEVVTDNPFWVYEKWPDEGNPNPTKITNDHFTPADFRIEIAGPVENPAITLGPSGNRVTYRVYAPIAEGNTLIIDSMAERVYVVDADDYEQSYFTYRDRNHWIFEKVPVGSNQTVGKSSGISNVSIVLYYKRSEPEWNAEGSARDASWFYELDDEDHVIETTYIYPSGSNITLEINDNGHLIESRPKWIKEGYKGLLNHFTIEEGHLIAHHD